MARLLHTADWQIGRTFKYGQDDDGHDPSSAMVKARFDVVAGIAELATERSVDAVLVAGDIFDRQGVKDTTLRRLFNALEGFRGPWVLMPGNHDAALAASVWTRAQQLGIVPDNVTLALEPKAYEFPELGIAVLAAPLTQRQTHVDLSAAFDNLPSSPGLLRIGLAHGSAEGILQEGIDSPNPIAQDRAARANLTYLALGDWHGTKRINERTWYSGTPEQDRYKDNDSGNVLLVEIDTPQSLPRVTVQRVGRFHWHDVTHELNGTADADRLIESLSIFDQNTVLYLKASGMTDLSTATRLEEALDAIRARVHVLEADLAGLRLEPSAADLESMQIDGFLQEVVGELRKLSDDPELGAVANEALKQLFDALRRTAGAAA
jgi:DNA repair exonuclease SbcCD nuclease subunit